jgi:hypothetical protein
MLRVDVFLYTIVAGIEIVGAIIAFLLGNIMVANASTRFPPVLFFVFIVVFLGTGTFLLMDSSRDRRAAFLGCVFLTMACTYSHALLVTFASREWALGAYISPLAAIQGEAFLPYFLWLFVRDFPHVSERQHRNYIDQIIRLCLAGGLLLALGNAVLVLDLLGPQLQSFYRILALFSRDVPDGYYWLVIFPMAIPALPYSLWRCRTAGPQERRRGLLFATGIAVGFTPTIIVAVGGSLSAEFYRVTITEHRFITALVAYTAMLAFPFITMYSVMVNQVLDVRLVFRKAVQYTFARSTVTALFLVPAVTLAAYLYIERQSTVTELFGNPAVAALVTVGFAGLALRRLRENILHSIDRRFFRENCDAREILGRLAERSRAAATAVELTELIVDQLDRAFHLEFAAVLLLDESQSYFRHPSGEIRQLSRSSRLMQHIEQNSEAVSVDLENPRSPLNRLSLDDREWLGDAGARLILPLMGTDGAALGLIVLGPKKSELPYARDDRLLLHSIAASAALSIENRLMREPVSVSRFGSQGGPSDDEYAVECPRCDFLQASRTAKCTECGGHTTSAAVPPVLLGKFRVERKIGRGGMGIVYRAVDLVLGRTVAIKALPKVAPEYSLRLRREARTMASVSHPNMALIFGAESWRGIPMLVFEFLEGGTLEDRLKSGQLEIQEMVDLGIVLASVLERTHEAEILHCDIKPSNIGFTGQRIPKLLDFGLAHILNDVRMSRALSSDAAVDSDATKTLMSTVPIHKATAFGPLAGTPAYLSPDALKGKPPSVAYDLWGLALVLYEAVTGYNPFKAPTIAETVRRVRISPIPNVRDLRPDCSDEVASFFAGELSRDARLRSTTALEFRRKLETLSLRRAAAHS